MDRRSRRQFVQGVGVVGLGLVAGCGWWPGQAAKPTVLPRIGVVMQGSPDMPDDALGDGFHQGLREHNLLDGQAILEYRYARNNFDLLPGLAAELVNLPVDVLVGVGGVA